MVINKSKETMTPRERVLNTFAYSKTDRVPINYSTNPTIHSKLMKALNCNTDESLLEALGIDYRQIYVSYKGPLIYKELPGLDLNPVYGYYTRWVENEFGGYHDYCSFPLSGAEDDVIAAFKYPSPDDFDYDAALQLVKAHSGYALFCGDAGFADIINSTGFVMGTEDILIGMQTENEAVLNLIDRKANLQLGILDRLLTKAKGSIDFLWCGEDLGTQNSPMISLELYRRILRPRHQKFVDLAKSYKLPVMFHTCGSSSWVYEDFIDMGITAVDTLQPEAKNMSPEYLVEHFGKRLSFHGCISTAGPLAYGTPDETAEYCINTLDIMMQNRGYHFSPTHQIQDNTPLENIIAMYQTAHTHGGYSL